MTDTPALAPAAARVAAAARALGLGVDVVHMPASTRTAEATPIPSNPIPATALVTSMRLILRKTLLGS